MTRCAQVVKEVEQMGRRLGIKVPSGLIGDDQGPVSHHRSGDTHSLALTTGEPTGWEGPPFR